MKYKFVLCILKEDRRNRSVSVYDIIKFFSTLYYKMTVYTVEVVISNQTELGAGGTGWLNGLFLIASLKISWVSETLYIYYLSYLLILYDLLKNFLLLKIYEKILGEKFMKNFCSLSRSSLSSIRGSYFNNKLQKDKSQFWWLR